MAKGRIVIDEKSVINAINNAQGTKPALMKYGMRIAERSNSLGAGYRTAKFHDRATGETRGGKQPEYGATLANRKTACFVHPENYAAMKDNYLHNTMLKAMG